MIFLDIPHVALRPFHRAKSIDSLMSACYEILSLHGLGSASFIGHSFGSLCISRMCQLFPEAVDSIVSPPSNLAFTAFHHRCIKEALFATLETCNDLHQMQVKQQDQDKARANVADYVIHILELKPIHLLGHDL